MEKTKTNFEKLKELKNWELAQVLDLIALHVDAAVPAYPDAQVQSFDYQREQLKWLNQPYDEEKGFKFILDDEGEVTYVTLQDMKINYEKQIFKGLLKKEEDAKQPLRTLGKFIGDYLIFKNSKEIEFFAEDGYGYTKKASEAGIFTLQEVEHFNAELIDYKEFLNRKDLKKEYLAISVYSYLAGVIGE